MKEVLSTSNIDVASTLNTDGLMRLVFQLMRRLVGTFLEWLNKRIALEVGRREVIIDSAFYIFLSMILHSQ